MIAWRPLKRKSSGYKNLHFHSKVMKFFWGLITILNDKVDGMKNNDDESPSISGCVFPIWVWFKILTTKHQYPFTVTHVAKRNRNLVKKETIHKFHVADMTHKTLKKNGTHRDQVIKKFEWKFRPVTLNCITVESMKRIVSVFSLMMFDENRESIMFKVIEAVIYDIIKRHIIPDYLGLFQNKWSKHEIIKKKTKSNNLSGLRIPKILMNIMSCSRFIFDQENKYWNNLLYRLCGISPVNPACPYYCYYMR